MTLTGAQHLGVGWSTSRRMFPTEDALKSSGRREEDSGAPTGLPGNPLRRCHLESWLNAGLEPYGDRRGAQTSLNLSPGEGGEQPPGRGGPGLQQVSELPPAGTGLGTGGCGRAGPRGWRRAGPPPAVRRDGRCGPALRSARATSEDPGTSRGEPRPLTGAEETGSACARGSAETPRIRAARARPRQPRCRASSSPIPPRGRPVWEREGAAGPTQGQLRFPRTDPRPALRACSSPACPFTPAPASSEPRGLPLHAEPRLRLLRCGLCLVPNWATARGKRDVPSLGGAELRLGPPEPEGAGLQGGPDPWAQARTGADALLLCTHAKSTHPSRHSSGPTPWP